MIINITDSSKLAIDNMFENYPLDTNKYLRVYLKEIAWHGPVFNVAQDEPTSKDNIYLVDNKYNIIINNDLCEKFTVVNIYYRSNLSYSDFYITTDFEWKDEYHYCEWSKPW